MRRLLACGLLLLIVGGCTRADGPPRFELSGQVTFNGAPVPRGTLQFIPDPEVGNTGPASFATIEQGVYRVRAEQGLIGGPYLVSIQGFDDREQIIPGEATPTLGQPLFPQRTVKLELPHTGAEHDFHL